MKAHELIKHPESWIKGDFAKDKDGHSIDPQSNEAFCFCALGAITNAYPNTKDFYLLKNKLYRYINKSKSKGNTIDVGAWNDMSTHEIVYNALKLLDI